MPGRIPRVMRAPDPLAAFRRFAGGRGGWQHPAADAFCRRSGREHGKFIGGVRGEGCGDFRSANTNAAKEQNDRTPFRAGAPMITHIVKGHARLTLPRHITT